MRMNSSVIVNTLGGHYHIEPDLITALNCISDK